MYDYWLIYPMFAMVLLAFSVLVKLFRARSQSVADGTMNASYFKTYQGQIEPESSLKLARHFANLFEAPVLFYVCCLAAMATNATSLPILALAWLYVIFRIAHAHIHTGSNQLVPRIYAYFSSWLVLLSMWTLLVFRVATLS